MIDVRCFQRRNLKRIAGIERASFGKDAWPAAAFLQYWREDPQLFLVARCGRRIAGYSLACRNWRGAELDSIAVDPRYRKRGVAQALLEATAGRLRSQGANTLRLMVSTTNDPALRFYRQYGFVRNRLVRDYYGTGRDAWRMSLDISREIPRSGPNQ